MAATVRFRPVILGPLSAPALVFHLGEAPNGTVWLREFDGARPILGRSLEEISEADLPVLDPTGRLAVTLLPLQTASGRTEADAFERMIAVLGEIERRGVPQARPA